MNTICLLILCTMGFIVLNDFIWCLVVEGIANDKALLKSLQKDTSFRRNSYNDDIFYIGNSPYMDSMPLTVFWKYYVNDIGVIPRWSKSHAFIKKVLKENPKRKVSKKPYW